jgi:hypothetical protein
MDSIGPRTRKTIGFTIHENENVTEIQTEDCLMVKSAMNQLK